MSLDLDFAYAQARIQARFARLPAEEEWQRLAASRTLASFLEEARSGPLRDWVKGFSGQSDAHELEAGLRSLYRETLEAVSGWVPAPWRDALSWTRWLMHLPLFAHLGAGGALPGWAARDPDLRFLLCEDGTLDRRRLAAAGVDVLMRPAQGLAAVWIAQWRGRWPRCGHEISRNLLAFTALLTGHVENFRRIPPDAAWSSRKELRERLRLRLHQRMLQPQVPFIYLALTALDLERLRAALVSRALFSAPGQAAA
jgi:hypothetical protein